MVTKQYKECDYCNNNDLQGIKIEKVFLQTGWIEQDIQADGKEYDLCTICLASLCIALLTQIRLQGNFDLNAAAVKVFEAQKKGGIL